MIVEKRRNRSTRTRMFREHVFSTKLIDVRDDIVNLKPGTPPVPLISQASLKNRQTWLI